LDVICTLYYGFFFWAVKRVREREEYKASAVENVANEKVTLINGYKKAS
jgi:hypothetical protein